MSNKMQPFLRILSALSWATIAAHLFSCAPEMLGGRPSASLESFSALEVLAVNKVLYLGDSLTISTPDSFHMAHGQSLSCNIVGVKAQSIINVSHQVAGGGDYEKPITGKRELFSAPPGLNAAIDSNSKGCVITFPTLSQICQSYSNEIKRMYSIEHPEVEQGSILDPCEQLNLGSTNDYSPSDLETRTGYVSFRERIDALRPIESAQLGVPPPSAHSVKVYQLMLFSVEIANELTGERTTLSDYALNLNYGIRLNHGSLSMQGMGH